MSLNENNVKNKGPRSYCFASTVIVVNKVLSIYRFLPGFREIAVFEMNNRFFIFLDGRYRDQGVKALAKVQMYILVCIL